MEDYSKFDWMTQTSSWSLCWCLAAELLVSDLFFVVTVTWVSCSNKKHIQIEPRLFRCPAARGESQEESVHVQVIFMLVWIFDFFFLNRHNFIKGSHLSAWNGLRSQSHGFPLISLKLYLKGKACVCCFEYWRSFESEAISSFDRYLSRNVF